MQEVKITGIKINPEDPLALIRKMREARLLKLEQTNPEYVAKVRDADERTAQETHVVDAMGGG